jgi:hypothetical protein
MRPCHGVAFLFGGVFNILKKVHAINREQTLPSHALLFVPAAGQIKIGENKLVFTQ